MLEVRNDSSNVLSESGGTPERDGFVNFVQSAEYNSSPAFLGSIIASADSVAGSDVQLPSYPRLKADGAQPPPPGFEDGVKIICQSAAYSTVQRPIDSFVQIANHLPGLELHWHPKRLVEPAKDNSWASEVGSTIGTVAVMTLIANTTDEGLVMFGYGDPTAPDASVATKLISSGLKVAGSTLITPVENADDNDYWRSKLHSAEGKLSGVIAAEAVTGPVKEFFGTTDFAAPVSGALTTMATRSAQIAINDALTGTTLTASQFQNVGRIGITGFVSGTVQQYTGHGFEGTLLSSTATGLVSGVLDSGLPSQHGQPLSLSQLQQIQHAGQNGLGNGLVTVVSSELGGSVVNAYGSDGKQELDDLIKQAIEAGVDKAIHQGSDSEAPGKKGK